MLCNDSIGNVSLVIKFGLSDPINGLSRRSYLFSSGQIIGDRIAPVYWVGKE
jgi:hypothetical protein